MTSRRDLSQAVASAKIETPSPYQRTRVEPVGMGQVQKKPRADNVEKRNDALLDKPCNKDRPKDNKSKGGKSRPFAGRYCK